MARATTQRAGIRTDDGEVRRWVIAGDLRIDDLPGRCPHADLPCVCDDVAIGHDVAIGRDHEARTGARRAALLDREADDRRTGLLDDAHHGLRVRIEQIAIAWHRHPR